MVFLYPQPATLGEQLVQGTDYAHMLQGWLKGVNSINLLNPNEDMGYDGRVGAPNQYIARDALGFNLDYFLNDYKSINPSIYPFAVAQVHLDNLSSATNRPLYNGNIAGMAVNIKFPNATAVQVPQYYNYKYDQLNRLTQMDVYRGYNGTNNSWASMQPVADYQERIAYDANGNILKYLRNSTAAPNINMDNLTYNYYPNTNQLKYVADNVADANYADDIDNQTNTSNYVYDPIGNLTKDAKENITLIKWNVYGKITEIQRAFTAANPVTNIQYTYDAAGNRISKRVQKNGTTTIEYTWYVRDASGNVMSMYNGTGTTAAVTSAYTLNLTEQHMYGSSRLGIINRNISIKTTFVKPAVVNFMRGNKFFELSNHLGNVLVTVSDKKIPVASTSNPNVIDYYNADVVTANDYYPGGMSMPGRKYSQPNTNYRYGFNGKEKSNEIYGEGNAYDFGARIQDPRLGGRFFSTDPMAAINPGESPYTFAGNNPVALTDFDGLFKISPYFAKKYPTLAKIIEHVLPLYVNNTTARDSWISNMGFSNQQAGISAWEEMLTYGKGPWITPTMSENELTQNGGRAGLSLFLGRFGEGSGNKWDNDAYANNISFSNSMLNNLETAIKQSNDEEVAFNTFRTMILIIHESGHWARLMKAHKPNRNAYPGEDGSLAEKAVFGQKFSYTNNLKDGHNADAIRDDLIRQTSNGARSLWKLTLGSTITSTLKKLPATKGQTGDPVLKDAKIKEGKVFVPSSTGTTNSSGSSGGAGKKNKDYSY